MRKVLAVLVFLFFSAAFGLAGTSFSTVMAGDEAGTVFEVSGDTFEGFQGSKYFYQVNYTLKVLREDISKISSKGFVLQLQDSDLNTVYSKKLDGITMKNFERREGEARVVFDSRPEFSFVMFRMNYSAEVGNDLEKKGVFGGFSANFSPPIQSLEGINFSNTTVVRGGKLEFNVSTSNVNSLSVRGGEVSSKTRNLFSGSFNINRSLSSGEHDVELVFTSGAGTNFTRMVSITVLNSPPHLSTTLGGSVFEKGGDNSFEISVSDDSPGNVSVELFVDGEKLNVSEGSTSIPESLGTGNYTFQMTAEDSEGKSKVLGGSFKIVEEKEESEPSEPDDSEQESEDFPVFGKFRDAVTGFFSNGSLVRTLSVVGLIVFFLVVYLISVD